jgi:hypothetical protein
MLAKAQMRQPKSECQFDASTAWGRVKIRLLLQATDSCLVSTAGHYEQTVVQPIVEARKHINSHERDTLDVPEERMRLEPIPFHVEFH